MKLKKILFLGLALTLLVLSPNKLTVWAKTPDIISPCYTYTQRISVDIMPSESEIAYNVRVEGAINVTSISGTMTIYKNNVKIYSTQLSSDERVLDVNDSITSYGSGTYKIIFNGNVYTASGSEHVYNQASSSY